MRAFTTTIAAAIVSLFGVGAASAQESSQFCTVTVAQEATVGGTHLSEGTTVFAGERLVSDQGGQVRLQCGSVRLALSESSAMRAFQSGTKTIVELEHGTITYATAGHSEDLKIYSLDIRIVPVTSQPAVGQVSSPSHCQISVRPSKSSAIVTSGRETKEIEESKSYEVTAEEGVDYRDDWKPVLTDYPDYPREADYHHSHGHVACAPAYSNHSGRLPMHAGAPSHFRILAAIVIVGITIPVIHEVLESPSKP
jgi:hypothetical protein